MLTNMLIYNHYFIEFQLKTNWSGVPEFEPRPEQSLAKSYLPPSQILDYRVPFFWELEDYNWKNVDVTTGWIN